MRKEINMERLTRFGSENLPSVTLDAQAGVFEIKGMSIPESKVNEFYQPILEWLLEYAAKPNAHTEMVFRLEFFNIPSSKKILEILYVLKEIADSEQSTVSVTWHYSNEFIMEVGEDLERMVKLPFQFVADAYSLVGSAN